MPHKEKQNTSSFVQNIAKIQNMVHEILQQTLSKYKEFRDWHEFILRL